MIKLFRKIRKSLLTENKTGRYLTYAIGEIILVVIGILIALGINNWNQNQNQIRREITSLNNLVLDIEDQIDVLDTYIKVEEEFYESGIYVMENYVKNKAFIINDSLLSKLNLLAFRNSFSPINTTFEELVSTGDIGRIRNTTLKRSIMQTYSHLERAVLVTTSNNTNLVDGIFNPVLLEQTLLIFKSNFKEAHVNDNLKAFQIKQNQIFDSASLDDLYKTSEKLLITPEKALNLFNVLQLRVLISRGQAFNYGQLKEDLTDLRIKIEQELER
jgi:hypothetical protein